MIVHTNYHTNYSSAPDLLTNLVCELLQQLGVRSLTEQPAVHWLGWLPSVTPAALMPKSPRTKLRGTRMYDGITGPTIDPRTKAPSHNLGPVQKINKRTLGAWIPMAVEPQSRAWVGHGFRQATVFRAGCWISGGRVPACGTSLA